MSAAGRVPTHALRPNMTQSDGLTIRRHQRHDVALDAQVALAPEHAAAVRFKPLPGVSGVPDGAAPVVLVDIGEGGFGVMSVVFLPRRSRIRLVVPDPRDDRAPALLDAHGIVQRVTMTDNRPGYLIGASFADEPAIRESLHRLLAALEGEAGDA